ncbi:MAG: hypothetical protein KZQ95_21960 [Candidatus Thiodiazotropha sp. (ex Epidulcina cf. delphinae)]|nr:hypothetical protein [Candidatus Thiodiazotropha sp. (ex Epidulcina cf. delphinae)]
MTESKRRSESLPREMMFLLFVVCAVNISHAYDIADVADPPGATMTYIGDVVQNGLPLQMKQFTADYPVAELLGFYKQRWSETADHRENIPPYIEKKVGEWRVLSKVEETSSIVVQVKEAESGSAEGFISVTDLSRPEASSQWLKAFPRLRDSELISSTESVDKGRSATTLVIVNDYSVADNRDYYRANMDALGWSYLRGGTKNNVSMLYFMKENQQCEIAVTQADDGKTVIFANLVETKENG